MIEPRAIAQDDQQQASGAAIRVRPLETLASRPKRGVS